MSGGEKANKNCITIDDYSFPCLTNYPRSCSTRVLLDTIRHKDPHSRYRRGSMNIYLLYGSDRYLHSLFLPFSPPRSSIFIGRSRHKVEPLRIHQVEKERVKGSAPLNKRRSRNSQLSLSQHLPLLWSILLFLSLFLPLPLSLHSYTRASFSVYTRVYILYIIAWYKILRVVYLHTGRLHSYDLRPHRRKFNIRKEEGNWIWYDDGRGDEGIRESDPKYYGIFFFAYRDTSWFWYDGSYLPLMRIDVTPRVVENVNFGSSKLAKFRFKYFENVHINI